MKQRFIWEVECRKDIREIAIFYGTQRPVTDFTLPSLRRPVHVLITYIFQVYFIDILSYRIHQLFNYYNNGILSSLLIPYIQYLA